MAAQSGRNIFHESWLRLKLREPGRESLGLEILNIYFIIYYLNPPNKQISRNLFSVYQIFFLRFISTIQYESVRQ
jgi:hypothetical protein